MKTPKADVVDVFSSIQGEGIFLGAKQVFVRFARCNLNCGFCDERAGDLPSKSYGPVELLTEVKRIDTEHGPHHSVVLTGGEPLVCVDFLRVFLKLLKRLRFRVYLETNGTMPDALRQIVALVDIVAMDFKLPSSTGGHPHWNEHLDFLKIASRKKVFVKAIVTEKTSVSDINKAVTVLKKVNEKIPFILQPATPVKTDDRMVDKEKLLAFLEAGSRHELENIRVIPQMHKLIGVK